MGMDLVPQGRGRKTFMVGFEYWRQSLRVARAFGWEPAGTLNSTRQPHETWDATNYSSNDWQHVTDDDAKAMAAALDRAMTAQEPLTDEQREALAWWGRPEEEDPFPEITAKLPPVPNADDFSRPHGFKAFANFARHGGFEIG